MEQPNEKQPGESGRQYAYRVLYNRILSLELPPGAVLNDGELAEALHVSRTPVREAILSLKEARLVEILPQRLSRVSLIDLDTVEEGVFLRFHAERAILKEAAGLADAQQLALLRENLTRQGLALERGAFDTFSELDNAFHRQLYLIAKKPWTWEIVTKSVTHLDRLRHLQLQLGEEVLRPSFEQHESLYRHIMTRSEENLDAFLYNHLTHGYRAALPKLLDTYPQYFKL